MRNLEAPGSALEKTLIENWQAEECGGTTTVTAKAVERPYSVALTIK